MYQNLALTGVYAPESGLDWRICAIYMTWTRAEDKGKSDRGKAETSSVKSVVITFRPLRVNKSSRSVVTSSRPSATSQTHLFVTDTRGGKTSQQEGRLRGKAETSWVESIVITFRPLFLGWGFEDQHG